METRFDPAKDAKNIANHKMSLAVFFEFDLTQSVTLPAKTVKGEKREMVITERNGAVLIAIVTERNGQLRPISVRPASDKEERAYADFKAGRP